MNPTIRAVLFDLDGTLIDSIPLILDSFVHTYRQHGIPVPDPDALMRELGIPLRQVFQRLTDDPDRIAAMIDTYREYNLATHDDRIVVFDGVAEMVEGVRERGLQVGVVTSKNRDGAWRGLRLVGLAGHVDALVSCDDVVRPKPDREPVDRALERLGAAPGTAVFVGDAVPDIESGRAAGVVTAAALWGPFGRAAFDHQPPDVWLERPADLLAWLDGPTRQHAV
jgi:pyrophosphatase PpaX